MEGVDKEKVQRVIYEMSKGSKYFENEERKEAFIKQKIETFCLQRSKLTSADLCHYQMVGINTCMNQILAFFVVNWHYLTKYW